MCPPHTYEILAMTALRHLLRDSAQCFKVGKSILDLIPLNLLKPSFLLGYQRHGIIRLILLIVMGILTHPSFMQLSSHCILNPVHFHFGSYETHA